MSLQRSDTEWLRRGRQRAAVARVLRKPMTASEICAAAREFAGRVQLRDVWFLMRQLEERKLTTCFNPRLTNGRLYALTDQGREAVGHTFGIIIGAPPGDVDWRKYSWVARARIRRLTLVALEELESHTRAPQTATVLRRRLREKYPVGLNPVIRALKELFRLGLIRQCGITEQRGCKVYRVTRAGRRIVQQLKR